MLRLIKIEQSSSKWAITTRLPLYWDFSDTGHLVAQLLYSTLSYSFKMRIKINHIKTCKCKPSKQTVG